MDFARDLKKGDRVQLTGELSYRIFDDAMGTKSKEATIFGTYIEKRMDYASAAEEL